MDIKTEEKAVTQFQFQYYNNFPCRREIYSPKEYSFMHYKHIQT